MTMGTATMTMGTATMTMGTATMIMGTATMTMNPLIIWPSKASLHCLSQAMIPLI